MACARAWSAGTGPRSIGGPGHNEDRSRTPGHSPPPGKTVDAVALRGPPSRPFRRTGQPRLRRASATLSIEDVRLVPSAPTRKSGEPALEAVAARGFQAGPVAGHRGRGRRQTAFRAVHALDARADPQHIRLERQPEAGDHRIRQLAPHPARGHGHRQPAPERRSRPRRQTQRTLAVAAQASPVVRDLRTVMAPRPRGRRAAW